MKYILILLVIFSSISCSEKKKKFVPIQKYINDTVYIKPDSSVAVIKFFGTIRGKDTTYFYGIEKDSNNKIVRRIIYDKDIFGSK